MRFGFQQGEIMEFQAILSLDAALAAVQADGYALQYVLCKDLFLKIAAELSTGPGESWGPSSQRPAL